MAEGETKKGTRIIGTIGCLLCTREVPVKEQANGLAMANCGWCSFQAYARGEEADSIIRKKMTAIPGAKISASPAPVKPAVVPAKKPTTLMDV